MQIIIGLGNPGKKYELTRHNVGFMAVNDLARQLGLKWKTNKKLNAEFAKGEGVTLVKPLTYMNNSGQAVKSILKYYKIPKKNELDEILTVIHDDIDISLGKYKFSIDSRSAGHKGVESIINNLKTKNFKRIRIGIRHPENSVILTEKFVLENFSEEEIKIITNTIKSITNKFHK